MSSTTPMQLGMIGLGRSPANRTERVTGEPIGSNGPSRNAEAA